MGFMLRVVEWGWLVVASLSLYEVVVRWGTFDDKFYIFAASLAIALFMFFLRRNNRLAYRKRQRERKRRGD